MSTPGDERPVYDRALLLHGAKRNEVLTLDDVQQYGRDSFSDADYISIYGMPPAEWYGRGVRLLGRTAVECTRDILGDRIGRDISELLAGFPSETRFVVIDPFAGSCNTLYWILRHVPNSEGVAFELDPQVYELSCRNVANLDRSIELNHGDYQDHLRNRKFPTGSVLVFFVAPPWGTALDEATGLDLRRTTPPITEIIAGVAETHPGHKLLFATQVYEKVNVASLADLQRLLDWSDLRVYDLNVEGRNHGVLLGTRGWKPGT